MFDDLREYSSPLKLDVRPCNINALTVQAWASLESRREGRDATLQDIGDTSLECLADPFHLEQVFRNVLENALAACDDPVSIEVEYNDAQYGDSSFCQVAIRDNGPGLSEEQNQLLFEPFFTTKTQGSGLGMAIVKQVVEAHRGTVEARCASGGGAEIVIALPSAVQSSDNRTSTEEFYA